ncbi:hypothetical protein [Azospirillum halopraeferens]|uniref:hypothetical protein n=1 Tax=Azospirillum halopraeferens TaxID=34010 RepID=UPI0004288A92|nr:hypothetical protein [Azospirillum halopraeferens]
MLREVWEYMAARAGRDARAMGYLAEAVALAARHRRQRRAWAPHVAAARRFVADSAALAAPGGRALVAGSGLLIEIPLDTLADRFDEVVLLDLVHLHPVRRAVRRFANVRLVEADVTGVLGPLRAALAAGAPLPQPEADRGPFPDGGFTFAVSCNLLSQIPLMPRDAIERRRRDDGDAFARALASAHVAWLRRVAPVAGLFTDIESLWLKDGALAGREDSLWGAALPPPDRTWTWDIAPAPEEDRRLDLRHTVGGWLDLNGTATPPPPPC